MERITKKMIEIRFDRFVELTGQRKANSYNDVGGVYLDNNGVYGGYVINRVINDKGGVSCPYGHNRRKTRDMFETLCFVCDVFSDKQYNEKYYKIKELETA